jgi:outer membrane protein assembly factor BamB
MPNIELNQVVCAGDGYVYVAARDGKVFKGRAKHGKNKELWKLIESDTKGLIGNPFEGATWYKGKLYLSTSYGLYELGKDEKIKAVDFGKEVQHSFQRVTSNDDILISYGPYNALVFDGTEWQTIVSSLVK